MKPILILILKSIASIFAVLELWCRFINAIILWDISFLDDDVLEKIWKNDLKTIK